MPLLTWFGVPKSLVARSPIISIRPPSLRSGALDVSLPPLIVEARATVIRPDDWLAGLPSDTDDALALDWRHRR